jgi:hypothetical protein
MEGSWWPNLLYCPSILPEKIYENQDKFDIRYPSLGLDQEIPEYKAVKFSSIFL